MGLRWGGLMTSLGAGLVPDARLRSFAFFVVSLSLPAIALAQETPDPEPGIPVTSRLVMEKCGTCHRADANSNLARISWMRLTPEGWQDVIRTALGRDRAPISAADARALVYALSETHGLAPEEIEPYRYFPERRTADESEVAGAALQRACTSCHGLGRALLSRRSEREWRLFEARHEKQFQAKPDAEARLELTRAFGLARAVAQRAAPRNLAGTWWVTAHVPGRGLFLGEAEVQSGAGAGEYRTRLTLRSAGGAESVVRQGSGVAYGGVAWRGRSKGDGSPTADPADWNREGREVLLFAADGNSAEGRIYWGEYQEFGIEVKLRKAVAQSYLLAIEGGALKAGTKGNRIRVHGRNLPVTSGASAKLDLGPGVRVVRYISRSTELVEAEVDVQKGAKPGLRALQLGAARLAGGIAIYDRIDYLKVVPESASALFAESGARKRAAGYRQFEVLGYHAGPDGRRRTADDFEVGPVAAEWSFRILYAPEDGSVSHVGSVSPQGLFSPANVAMPGNYDVWVTATSPSLGLSGKAYLTVSPAFFVFNQRRFVRDFDHWIDDGPVEEVKGGPQR